MLGKCRQCLHGENRGFCAEVPHGLEKEAEPTAGPLLSQALCLTVLLLKISGAGFATLIPLISNPLLSLAVAHPSRICLQLKKLQ